MAKRLLRSLLGRLLQVGRSGWQEPSSRKPVVRQRPTRWLAVEPLEDRTLPSTLLSPIPVFNPTLPESASAGGVAQPNLSYDGRYVVYTSAAPNLVTGQVNRSPAANIFLYDTQNHTNRLVSHVPGQLTTGANGPSAFAYISGDDHYVAYSSEATDLVPGQTGPQSGVRGLSNVFLYDVNSGTNTLISHAAGAPSTSGNDHSQTGGTTGFGFTQNTGHYLLFLSAATNLVFGQDNSSRVNLFVYDTQLQTTILVSHTPGTMTFGGNDDTYSADISEDGSTIVYTSLATNLVPNQQGQPGNVFLYDNRPGPTFGSTLLASGIYDPFLGGRSSTIGGGFVSYALISADGQMVTYISSAPNLVPFQSTDFDSFTGQFYPPSPNVFALSGQTGQTYLLSGAVTPFGASPSVTTNGAAARIAISRDGSSVAFISSASDQYPTQSGFPGQGRNSGNVFVADLNLSNLPQERLRLVSYDFSIPPDFNNLASPAGGVVIRNTANYTDLSISADGRFITYQAQQLAGQTGPLVGGQNGPDGVWNAFIFDQASDPPYGTNALLSRVNGTSATTGNFDTTGSRVSGNGTTAAFVSEATNLNPSNLPPALVPENGANLFVFPAFSSGPSLLSTLAATQVNAQTLVYGTSQDGRFVVFTSNSPTVVPGQVDANGDHDAFVYDRLAGTITLVSHLPGAPLVAGDAGSPNTSDGTQPPGAPVVISQDGNWIAFVSDATNLVFGQFGQPQTPNIFLFDNRPGPTYGQVTLVSHLYFSLTTTDIAPSFNPVLSADGRYLAFVSFSKGLLPGLTGEPGDFFKSNVFLYDRLNPATGMVLLSDFDDSPKTGNGNSLHPSISDDGRYVAFQSYATDLLASGPVAPTSNIYVFDKDNFTTTLVTHRAFSTTDSANAACFDPVVSPDGSFVAFVSFATDLVPGQQPPVSATPYTNVFVYDNRPGSGGTVRLVSGINGSPTATAGGFSDSPALSPHGNDIAFRSAAPNLVTGQQNTPGTTSNIFLFDQTTGAVTLLSHKADAATTTAAGNSQAPTIVGADDGMDGLIVYVSTATNLVAGQQGGGVNNVFLYSIPQGVNALVSGVDGSPVVANSTNPSFLALISRDPVAAFNSLSGVGGTSVAYVNKLVEVVLSPNTVAGGSPPGTVVGTLSVISVLAGQYLPPRYRLPGAEANNALFTLGATTNGKAPLLLGSSLTQPGYQVRVHVDIGLGDDPVLLAVYVGSSMNPIPTPVSPARPLTARLVAMKVGRKKIRLMVQVLYADTGAEKETFASPYQKPACRNIQVSLRDSNGDGVPDQVVLTAKKGKKKVTTIHRVRGQPFRLPLPAGFPDA
jgi:hypothetical protein